MVNIHIDTSLFFYHPVRENVTDRDHILLLIRITMYITRTEAVVRGRLVELSASVTLVERGLEETPAFSVAMLIFLVLS